jgi:gliding motility-associated-like protein
MNLMRRYKILLLCLGLSFFFMRAKAQCPQNIGFELGNFNYWECSIGSISNADGTISLSSSGPVYGRHTLISTVNGQVFNDRYGGFPQLCPNGSGYSIRLGNNGTGRQAEQVSYTFTIPQNQNNYSIIYNYAVVFQNPTHAIWEQPKFTANVYDVTNGNYIGCSSFSYAASSNLPGFKMSSDSVFYKDWTPVTIKLSGYAGHTIRLEFTTNDCTRGGHFGYAYVDVNEDCTSPITGNIQCASDTTQRLVAPYGFATYRWFTGDFSRFLDSSISHSFNPLPKQGEKFAVEVTPYPDQGCIDTVYTTIEYTSDTITLKTPASPLLSCVTTGIDLTSANLVSGSSPGLKFDYYTDATQQHFVTAPKFITQSGVYYIKATNSAGCTSLKPVHIEISTAPAFTVTTEKTIVRPLSLDLSTLVSGNTKGITFTYWKDSLATIPLTDSSSIKRSGTYYIKGTNEGGCEKITKVTVTLSEPPIDAPNAFSPHGDGIHDVWEIPTLALYPDCTVEIFNRLGQSIFRSTGYGKPWDGTYKGTLQPVGTYYYVIRPAAELPYVGGSVTIVK